jgi:ATP-dependent Clp protease ATP-binding subunit ClpA
MRGSVEQELDPDLKSVETRNLQERMRRKIVGQDEAVQAVDSTRRSWTG